MLRLVRVAETLNEQVVHPRVVAENPQGSLSCRGPPWGARHPSPTPGSSAQNTSARERKPHNIWLWKSVGILSIQVRRKAARIFLKSSCKTHLLACSLAHSQALILGSGEKTVAWWVPNSYREKLSCMVSGQGWRDNHRCPFIEPSSHRARRWSLSSLCWALPPQGQTWIY